MLINQQHTTREGIGGKAKNLARMGDMGIPVPAWSVIPEHVLLNQIPEGVTLEELPAAFNKVEVPASVIEELKAFFGDNYADKTYAVRSSAVDEDGKQFSFAGQFETFLHVRFEDIEENIKAIWRSVSSDRVVQYRTKNGLDLHWGIGVIVQEMVDAEVAGVAFGMDPLTGDTDTQVVSAVYGLGEGLVSGELDADTFTLNEGTVTTQLAQKTHAFHRGADGKGVVTTEVASEQQDKPTLSDSQVKEIATWLKTLHKEIGTAQDIEFAYANGKLFLLQTRPITAFGGQKKGEYILWDNSNIIESYPGITTPLTFSFIIKMYEMVYRQFVGLMGVTEKEVNQHEKVFANMLGLVRGRVYYNLLNWYKMLAMLPGYSINAEFMENMMGVKERFDLEEDYQMSKGLARFRLFTMVIKTIIHQWKLPRERKSFMKHLNKTIDQYEAMDFYALSSEEIVKRYKHFETSLLLKWKAPLVNDFFAMIWFGVLQKQTKKYCPEEPNIHNDLLCGSQDIISVEPIHRSIAIANAVQSNEEAKALFLADDHQTIWKKLTEGQFPEIKAMFEEYIQLFGGRCVGELKLETISYSQDPSLFVKIIKSYVMQGVTQKRLHSNLEEELRETAEKSIHKALKGKTIKKKMFNYILNKARDMVSNRENLRYERTRAFGMVRKMFIALGEQLHKEGKLDNARDIFYMELPEIKAIDTTGFDAALKGLIEERKAEFETYATQEPPQERFFTYGMNFTDEYIYSTEKLEPIQGELSGIGCCPGRVQAKVRVVRDPNEIDSLNGDILVTSSTDPGWVTLFPTASAIIVERGSLLSHSAIVSREMGIPCIVSVTGLLRTLNSGDEVLMDGSTGEIKIIKE